LITLRPQQKGGEDLLFAYAKETGVPLFLFRLPNVFGKWCRPNYNCVCGHLLPTTSRAACPYR
jgi:nucleoside-diphosphate-sugar epimerase